MLTEGKNDCAFVLLCDWVWFWISPLVLIVTRQLNVYCFSHPLLQGPNNWMCIVFLIHCCRDQTIECVLFFSSTVAGTKQLNVYCFSHPLLQGPNNWMCIVFLIHCCRDQTIECVLFFSSTVAGTKQLNVYCFSHPLFQQFRVKEWSGSVDLLPTLSIAICWIPM